MVQDPAPWRLEGVHHLGLTVADLERSIRFYRDVLGLALARRRIADADYIGRQTGFPGVRLEAASLRFSSSGGPTLELVQYATHAGAPADPATNRAGNSHLCLLVDDIERAYSCLEAQGVRFKTTPVAITSGPNTGGFVVYFLDPDDYTLELFQPPAYPAPAPELRRGGGTIVPDSA
jgi:catechol 2,3-dioxygenase-like lactoylglutathione lyase family enzyme